MSHLANHIEAKIVNALLLHMEALPLPLGVNVSYPGRNFTPNTEKPYLRVQVFKGDPDQPRIRFGNEPIRRGFLQISVDWPEGQGIIEAIELAGCVRDHFARGTKIEQDGVSVQIIEEPRVAGEIQEPAWVQVPVTIPWVHFP